MSRRDLELGAVLALFNEEKRRRLLSPLESKLAKLTRTLDKVRAEATRLPLAEEHRRSGELLSRNLNRFVRGSKEVRVVEYGADGPVESVVTVDPRRGPKEEVAWHFKEYKRLVRGSELAGRRAEELEAERAKLARRIETLRLAPAEELPDAPVPAAPRVRKEQAVAKPYREYLSHGIKIWVGKNARGNDALTFGAARPHDVWLHARGVPGSHVVVCVGKKAPLPQEVLLDAAHLALHHSQLKGERRGEVAYTQVKNLRRVKGGAPGQVTYTQEKTFLVRLEPARLQRLAASVKD